MRNTAMNQPLDIMSLAEALRQAESNSHSIEPLTDSHPELDLDTAYAIQRAGIEYRLAAGEKLIGRKIGLTSIAIQRQLGVDQPDYGAITDAMEVENGGQLDPALMVAPRIEAEFAFKIGQNLTCDPSYDDVIAAVDGIALSMEIIDSRIRDWRITLFDTVADNASMARVVWGEFLPATGDLLTMLPELTLSLHKDDELVCAGTGAAVLGHPLRSLHWLAGAIGAQGDALKAGDRVLSGAVAAAVDFTPGSNWVVSAEAFPSASVQSTPTVTYQQ